MVEKSKKNNIPCYSCRCPCFALFVLILNKLYKGQIPNKEVSRKMAATVTKTIPNIPLRKLVKKRMITSRAITSRADRSTVPIFVFILFTYFY
jgi:hypothetical protein